MESMKNVAEKIKEKLFSGKLPVSDTEVCPTCFGTQSEVVAGGARPCPTCSPNREAQRRQLLLEKIPRRYRGVTLERLQPRVDLHPAQPQIIQYMLQHPFQNYYLCGEPDTGKTHLMWAFYEHAVATGRNVIATTLHDWIESHIALYRQPLETNDRSTLMMADLQQSKFPYSVFIDDIDKKKVTEYVADMFFKFVDTIYLHQHQLVVTSQLHPSLSVNGRDSLIDHFRDGDPRYGLGIARRLVNDETAVWEMF